MIRNLTRPGGRFVLTTAHPFRFVVEKMERLDLQPAVAYRDQAPYSYPSTWDDAIVVSHSTPTLSCYINSFIGSGFRLDRFSEPDLSPEHRQAFPTKAAWMDRYFGIVVYEATAL
jgi:hypothetical protein